MKRILAGTVLMIMALPCYGAGENIPTSRAYVDGALSLKQAKFPAANSGLGSGTSVLTYTATSGTIGERALYTDASSYDASNDADKLITASALNGAVTSLPTETTTKLVCANPGTCDLWNIVDQTAYAGGSSSGGGSGSGNSAAIMTMLTALADEEVYGWGSCYESLYGQGYNEGCDDSDLSEASWGAMFDYNDESVQISGISACSTLSGEYGQVASNQSTVQSDYEGNMSAAPMDSSDPVGGNCYCKMTDPNTGGRWVFLESSSAYECKYNCAARCAGGVIDSDQASFRATVFGVTQ